MKKFLSRMLLRASALCFIPAFVVLWGVSFAIVFGAEAWEAAKRSKTDLDRELRGKFLRILAALFGVVVTGEKAGKLD